jgi:hypothetical protein
MSLSDDFGLLFLEFVQSFVACLDFLERCCATISLKGLASRDGLVDLLLPHERALALSLDLLCPFN